MTLGGGGVRELQADGPALAGNRCPPFFQGLQQGTHGMDCLLFPRIDVGIATARRTLRAGCSPLCLIVPWVIPGEGSHLTSPHCCRRQASEKAMSPFRPDWPQKESHSPLPFLRCSQPDPAPASSLVPERGLPPPRPLTSSHPPYSQAPPPWHCPTGSQWLRDRVPLALRPTSHVWSVAPLTVV